MKKYSGNSSHYCHPGFTAGPNNPITSQPKSTNVQSHVQLQENVEGIWMMPLTSYLTNCPAGLEYLTTVDTLFVKKKVQFFGGGNKYTITNKNGNRVYYSVENSNLLNKCCCSSESGYTMKVFDNTRAEIIQIHRNMSCGLKELNVYAPPNYFVGSVIQQTSCCQLYFDIADHSGRTIFKIESPSCSCCGMDSDFPVLSMNEEVIGKISKLRSGFFTNSADFEISFPADLDVRMKAVLIGACFFINFVYDESRSGVSGDV